MNDRPDEHSGSRWEPAPQPPAGDQGPEARQEPSNDGGPAAGPFAADEHAPPATEDRSRRFSWRGRGPLVALATGIVALSGVGGYALGNAATADAEQVGLVGNQTPGDGQLPGNGAGPYGDEGDLQGVPPWGKEGRDHGRLDGEDHGRLDGEDHGWRGEKDHGRGDRDGDGEHQRWGHHGPPPGTPPGGEQTPSPDGSSGTTSDGAEQGRET